MASSTSGTRRSSRTACVAALSGGVPSVGLAHSLKFQGVFESCAQGEAVVDLCSLDNAQALEALWNAWSHRDRLRASLGPQVASVQQRAQELLEETLTLD